MGQGSPDFTDFTDFIGFSGGGLLQAMDKMGILTINDPLVRAQSCMLPDRIHNAPDTSFS